MTSRISFEKLAGKVFKPDNVVLLTVMVSFCAWMVPFEHIRRGYSIKEVLSVKAILILFLWYGLIFVFSKIGFQAGKGLKKVKRLDTVTDKRFYHVISLISIFGVLYVCVTIIQSNPEVVNYVIRFQANQLKNALYSNYETGLHSLRYLSVLGGGMALYYLFDERKIRIIHLVNLGALLVTSFISSRLSIILALFVFFGILIKKQKKISIKVLTVLVIVLFALLTLLNYYRNANAYKYNYNISNPIVMNLSEMVTYLGSPFQVSVGVANHLDQFKFGDVTPKIKEKVLPTYLQKASDEFTDSSANNYRQFVDVEDTLTTNSAFTSFYSSMGNYSFVIILLISLIFSFLAGHFSQYGSYLFLIQYVTTYCFAEIWRTSLFNAGIVQILILTLLFIGIVGGLFSRTVNLNEVSISHANH